MANIATLDKGGAKYYSSYGWYSSSTSYLTVTAAEGITITKVKFTTNNNDSCEDTDAPFQVQLDGYYVYYGYNFSKNLTGDGVTKIEVYGNATPAATTYSVKMADATDAEAANWTIASGGNSVTGNVAEGLTGLSEGDALTLTYSGSKKVKSVKAVVEAATPAGTDLSMVDCAGKARTKMWTANCYMVHTKGDYKLPLVYGNAIKNGAVNEIAYKPGSQTTTNPYTANFVNHNGDAINAPWITKAAAGEGVNKGMGITVNSASLLWQDAEGLITEVGIDGDYLTLTVGKDADGTGGQEGNAVIAVKSGNDIVWSWHIWVTKQTFATADLTTITTTDDISTGTQGVDWQVYKVTPVNLGWVSTGGDGKQGYNTFYQWGRKDPFKGTGAPAEANVYNIDGTAVTGFTYDNTTTAEIKDNIMNPTTFYNVSNRPSNTTYYNMWDAQNTAKNNVKTATKKTVYDPCPPGFCVPTDNLYNYAGGQSSSTTWDGTNKGRTWQGIFFPASGSRSYGSGTLSYVGSRGYCWSASPNSDYYGRTLYFKSDGWTWYGQARAYGFPVRPVAEE